MLEKHYKENELVTNCHQLKIVTMTKKKKLRFYKGTHTYWYGRTKLESVTTFIHRFFNPFEEKKIARKLSKFYINKKRHRGVRYFIKEWKKNREDGTKVHTLLEKHTNNEFIDDGYNKIVINKFKKGILAKENILKQFDNFSTKTELQIYDLDFKLAGSIDLFIEDYETKKISLVDWKTSKKIYTDNTYKKFGTKETTKNIADINFNIYTLQLSLYAYILEKQGYEIDKLYLAHLMEDDYKIYNLNYRKDIIKSMLEEK